MRKKILLIYVICTFAMTGCRLTMPGSDDLSHDNLMIDETSSSDTSIEDNDDGSADASNSLIGSADDLPWESPMADYVPDSPYSSYISFVSGKVITKWDDEYFSDYVTGKYKYACCDLSGDGVPELVILYQEGDKEKIITFSYDEEDGTIYESLKRGFNSECDYISNNGFVLLYEYEDTDGKITCGKTEDENYIQRIHVKLSRGFNDISDSAFLWERGAGSSEYEGPSEEIYNRVMEMAEDQVTLFDGDNPEDIIPYLEECEENFENSYEYFKLFKQQGNGLFYRNNSDIPDNEYKDAESAYEAFINDETCVRCEYVKEPFNSDFSYVYGDKYNMSSLFYPEYSQTMDSHLIDCGSDGSKELVVDITSTLSPETIDYLYVISFYEGHLYLRFAGQSSSRARIDIGDDGYIIYSGSSSVNRCGVDEAFLDNNIEFHYVYKSDEVSNEGLKDFFPEAYEISPAGDVMTIYIYDIDGKKYYVPYFFEEVTDEEDYSDFMNACIECGISFSSQEEVDALIEEKKAEYGF
ncbi:hypothetical protein [Butyrivibrio fibrisolvens]|nr:hypothetical protein [Butyrivibrio fibrisolvens]